ncbi:hypothetical protein ACIQU6_33845 [Streptomyces sp. NPDC090442]|uniref:hypothetical protein n=1 Tax=Streptomyces sp. NPDC090442 TaxID=3365962 RepID=UPI00381BFB21
MNKDQTEEEFKNLIMAIESGVPIPQHDSYEVTVGNLSTHALVLTSMSVSGSFDRAPEPGHVLTPGGTDTFLITTTRLPSESGAASLRYQMADAPVSFTAMVGPDHASSPTIVLEGQGCEEYAGTIERGGRSKRSFIALEQPRQGL